MDKNAQVQFINFRNVLKTHEVTRVVTWSSVLACIFSYYTTADLILMVELMNHFPSGVGTSNARKTMENIAYQAYWTDTGLDMWTGKAPTAMWLDWVEKHEYGKKN